MASLSSAVSRSQSALLFSRLWCFSASFSCLSRLPDWDGVEVVFWGRSNVGKSSLINAVLNRRSLARTSKTPGCTTALNFYVPSECSSRVFGIKLASFISRDIAQVAIVDVPGYGFARYSNKMGVANYKLVSDYFRYRTNLSMVYLLVDSRHGIKTIDMQAVALLDKAAVPYRVVLTKIDKLVNSPNDPQIRSFIDSVRSQLRVCYAGDYDVLSVSSLKKWGIELLRKEMYTRTRIA